VADSAVVLTMGKRLISALLYGAASVMGLSVLKHVICLPLDIQLLKMEGRVKEPWSNYRCGDGRWRPRWAEVRWAEVRPC
jgi:hypothetical protein